jgi:hypothetical protein
MSGFTKLVPEIVMSSIWNESPEVRCVWITMLAIKDENGIVLGTDETLARIANVTLQHVTDAIERFSSPDKNSRTPDNEGRRIAKYDGGWIVLNHGKYRANDAVLREKTRERVRRFREKKAMEKGYQTGNVTETLPSASASASVSASEIKDRVQGKGKWKGKDSLGTQRVAASDAAGKLTPEHFPAKAQAANGGRLTEQQLEAFCAYWTERNSRGRCRFEAEKFFELPKRIATWARRDRVAPAPAAAAKQERPIWKDCAARCRHWDADKRWCSKFVKTEPKSCEQCKEF